MKTLKFSVLAVLILTLAFSCKKDEDDTTGPSIKLNGNLPTEIALNAAYTDLGATAYDAEDGDVTSRITKTGTVNVDKVGDYVLTYNATDNAGNRATSASRTVQVRNDADYIDGFYAVSYSMVGGTSTNTNGSSSDEISSSNTLNYRFSMKFPGSVYGTVVAGLVTIPQQGDPISGEYVGNGSMSQNGVMNLSLKYTKSSVTNTYTLKYTKN